MSNNAETQAQKQPSRHAHSQPEPTITGIALKHVLKGTDFKSPWPLWQIVAWVLTASLSTASVLALLKTGGTAAVAWAALVLMLIWLGAVLIPFLGLRDAYRDRSARWVYVMELVESYLKTGSIKLKPKEVDDLLKFHAQSSHRKWEGAVVGYFKTAAFAFGALGPFALVIHWTNDWGNPFLMIGSLFSTSSMIMMVTDLVWLLRQQHQSVIRGDQRFERVVGQDFE